MSKSRQELAYDKVSDTFVKLLENDTRISYEHKRSVIAFWQDLFAHEGVRNNMIQAFSNFLWDQDNDLDAKVAGELAVIQNMILHIADPENENTKKITETLTQMINERMDKAPMRMLTEEEIAGVDLSEVGGGDEDDTPLI